MVSNVGRTRNDLHQLGQVGRAAYRFELSLSLESLGQGDLIDDLSGFGELEHGTKNFTVSGAIEIFFDNQLHGLGHGLVVQQDGTKDGLLRLDVLRRQFRLREVDARHGFHFDSFRRRRDRPTAGSAARASFFIAGRCGRPLRRPSAPPSFSKYAT